MESNPAGVFFLMLGAMLLIVFSMLAIAVKCSMYMEKRRQKKFCSILSEKKCPFCSEISLTLVIRGMPMTTVIFTYVVCGSCGKEFFVYWSQKGDLEKELDEKLALETNIFRSGVMGEIEGV